MSYDEKCLDGWALSSDGTLMDIISRDDHEAEVRLHMVIRSFNLLQAAKLALSSLMSSSCTIMLLSAVCKCAFIMTLPWLTKKLV